MNSQNGNSGLKNKRILEKIHTAKLPREIVHIYMSEGAFLSHRDYLVAEIWNDKESSTTNKL